MTRARTSKIVVLAICATFAALAASAARSAPADERVMGVAGSVERISADGGWVAISSHLEGGGLTCDRAAAWRPASGAVVRFDRRGQCGQGGGSSDDAVVDLYFAGRRTIFTSYSFGRHAYCDAVWTATIAVPKPARVRNAPCSGAAGDADQIFELAGSSSLIAVASSYYCFPAECQDDNGNQLPEGNYNVVLWRLSGARLVRLARVADRSRLLSAAAGRFVLLLPGGSIVLYSASGEVLRTLRFERREVVDAELSGRELVVRTRRSIRVFDAVTGSPTRTLRLAPGARLMDVEGDLAVYARGRTIHVLRFSDGRDRAYATVTGLVDAQLERSGLYYAYNLRSGVKPGRVAFVPSADLAELLKTR